MTSFDLIKTSNQMKDRRVELVRSLPKPRKKQWWEKLVETEYDYFYSKFDMS